MTWPNAVATLRLPITFALAVALPACASDDASSSGGTDSSGTSTASSTATATATSTASSTAGTDSASSETGTSGGPVGCTECGDPCVGPNGEQGYVCDISGLCGPDDGLACEDLGSCGGPCGTPCNANEVGSPGFCSLEGRCEEAYACDPDPCEDLACGEICTPLCRENDPNCPAEVPAQYACDDAGRCLMAPELDAIACDCTDASCGDPCSSFRDGGECGDDGRCYERDPECAD